MLALPTISFNLVTDSRSPQPLYKPYNKLASIGLFGYLNFENQVSPDIFPPAFGAVEAAEKCLI